MGCKIYTKGGRSMLQNLSLVSLALPYRGVPVAEQMQPMPADDFVGDIAGLDHKDILLLDQQKKAVGWIPYQTIVQSCFEQLKNRTAQSDALLDAVDEAVTITDSKGCLIGWNHNADRLYHYTEKKAFGQPITRYFKREALVLLSVLKDGKKILRKYNQPAPHVHVLINCIPIILNKKIIGAISVEKNINDMVKLNEELFSSTSYIHHLENRLDRQHHLGAFYKIKGRSPALHAAVNLAKKVAETEASVLLIGESGVGKELFAEAIHQSGKRACAPFVAVNCGAIPSELFESELFGYERGAFTGALIQGKKGRIDVAQGGTLFLDEIGEMPMELQVKLLRVLQEKKYYRVGGNQAIPMNVRIIAATNQNLKKLIAEKRFRADLYYRLNVVSIRIPSLRERIEDIPQLVQIYLHTFAVKYQKPIPKIDPDVMVRLLQYDWPGNIRELRNTIERLMILLDGERVTDALLPDLLTGSDDSSSHAKLPPNHLSQKIDREMIQTALTKTFGNKSAAAKLLGISRATLYNRLKKIL
jgi:transcriptional regulator with PAS, ATPase and Fis domain